MVCLSTVRCEILQVVLVCKVRWWNEGWLQFHGQHVHQLICSCDVPSHEQRSVSSDNTSYKRLKHLKFRLVTLTLLTFKHTTASGWSVAFQTLSKVSCLSQTIQTLLCFIVSGCKSDSGCYLGSIQIIYLLPTALQVKTRHLRKLLKFTGLIISVASHLLSSQDALCLLPSVNLCQ